MTSGLSGSPAPTHLAQRRPGTAGRSAWISIRHTVGGAQNVVTSQRTICVEQRRRVEPRVVVDEARVASAIQGAKTLLHACLAQPGEETLRCTSPGCRPIQYIVDRCPTG